MSKKATDSPISMTSSMLQTGLGGLEAYVKKTADTVKESRDVEAAESFAHLLTKVAQVASELRKAEAAERKAATEVSRSDMVDAFRSWNDTDQQRFIRELEQQRKKGSGLA